MGHFEHTDKGDVFVTDINDYFESLDCLIRECKGYIDSELRYKEIIAEHDKQIRAEVIDNLNDIIHEIYKCQFYCMTDMCEHDSPTVDMCIDCFYDAIQKSLEHLKEQK